MIRPNSVAHDALVSLECVSYCIRETFCAPATHQMSEVTTKVATPNEQAVLAAECLFKRAPPWGLLDRARATLQRLFSTRELVRARGGQPCRYRTHGLVYGIQNMQAFTCDCGTFTPLCSQVAR